jgi:hypothetical protein
MTTLERAILFAVEAHAGQKDKQGHPYILHPLAVANDSDLPDERHRIVAVLHDVIEDTNRTFEDIKYGFGLAIARDVEAISARYRESRDDYYIRVLARPVSTRVKKADIRHNSSRERLDPLDDKTRKRLMVKYTKAREVFGMSPIDTGPPVEFPAVAEALDVLAEFGADSYAASDAYDLLKQYFHWAKR